MTEFLLVLELTEEPLLVTLLDSEDLLDKEEGTEQRITIESQKKRRHVVFAISY
jgi:hypothetical protein